MVKLPEEKREEISQLRAKISSVREARERSAREMSRQAIDELFDTEIDNLKRQLQEERRIAALQVVNIEERGAKGAPTNRPDESGRPAEEDPAV